ncbi:MAG: hypothetical protein U0401_17780 [Anaerolineae bacterium]
MVLPRLSSHLFSPPGAVVGQLKPAIAQSLGLSHQVQVIAGAAVTACAAFTAACAKPGKS